MLKREKKDYLHTISKHTYTQISMMKSVAINAVVLYILFKSSVRDQIIAKLPEFVKKLQSFQHLLTLVRGFLEKNYRMSRRSTACVLFLIAMCLLNMIWQRFNGNMLLSSFVEKYLIGTE